MITEKELNTLNHKVFEEMHELKLVQIQTKETFFNKAVRRVDAQEKPTSDGFVVFKGPNVTTSTIPSITSNLVKLREQLLETGAIIRYKTNIGITRGLFVFKFFNNCGSDTC